MKKILPLLICLFVASLVATAQEFNFSVTLNTQKVQTADPKVFESLKLTLQEFLNNQKWTEDEFEPEEKIDCNLQITINEELSATSFKADVSIRATRPVYGTDYQTTLLNYIDKGVVFDYEAYQPIQFSDNNFESNLSSILAFYCYTVLGLDYDTFSPLGGEIYLQKAQDIINTIPPSVTGVYKGWRALDGNRNRYWLIENILSPRIRKMRQAMYTYHRQGLDLMTSDVATGRATIAEVIKSLETVDKDYPNSMIIQMFSLAKGDEIVEIFKGGTAQEQNDVVRVMSRLDGANASKYRKIRK